MNIIKVIDDLLFGDGGQSARSKRIHHWLGKKLRKHRRIRKQLFILSAVNHKGGNCPYKSITCQEGWCSDCFIYQDWKNEQEIKEKDKC